MIRRRRSRRAPSGYYHLESVHHRSAAGFGDGSYIRLKDENGNVWRGEAEVMDDDTIRYRFRDNAGHTISGISDHFGIVLRDEKGNSWRGYVF